MVNIRTAVIDDVYSLCNRLRKQDSDEVKALVGLTDETALAASFRESDSVFVAEINEKIICMFGVCKNIEGGGFPWLLGSDDVEKVPITFIRKSRKYVKQFLNDYGFLENYVDTRNTLSVQWLRWLGFNIESPQPFGIEGRLFSRFTLGGENKCV